MNVITVVSIVNLSLSQTLYQLEIRNEAGKYKKNITDTEFIDITIGLKLSMKSQIFGNSVEISVYQ